MPFTDFCIVEPICLSVGTGNSRTEVWLWDELKGQEGTAAISTCSARRWHQLRDTKVGVGRRGRGWLEHWEPGVWQWRSSAAEGQPWHSQVCLQVQFCCCRRQTGNRLTECHTNRVATTLENLEYAGISLNMENSENSRNSVQPQGKIVTNKVFLVCHSNICVIFLELMWNDPWWRSLLRLLFVAITYGKVSIYGSGKAWKTQGIFFSYFVATLTKYVAELHYTQVPLCLRRNFEPCQPIFVSFGRHIMLEICDKGISLPNLVFV